MATLPIVNTIDKRVGIISAIATMLITIIVLMLLTYDMPNPLPVDKKVVAAAEITQIELKELVIEGGAGGGTPTQDEIAPPKPETQQVITSTKPRPTSTPTGAGNNTTAPNSTQNGGSTNPSNDPFAKGGNDGDNGGGNGTGANTNDGSEGTGLSGIGNGKGRKAIGTLDVEGISIETDATIVYKLTVDKDGNVTGFTHLSALSTTTNLVLINKIGNEIKRQIKFTPGNIIDYIKYPVKVKAT